MFFYLSLWGLNPIIHHYCLIIARDARLVAIFSLSVIARLLSRGNLPQSALIMRSPRSQMLARDDEVTNGQSDDAEKHSLRHCESLKARGNLLQSALIMRSPRSQMLARDDEVTEGQSDADEKHSLRHC